MNKSKHVTKKRHQSKLTQETQKDRRTHKELDKELDKALESTFPASDATAKY